MKRLAFAGLLLALGAPANDPQPRKPGLVDGYSLSLLSVDLSLYESGFVRADQLLPALRSLRRAQDGKPLSADERLEAMKGFGLVAGVYQAFLDGLYVERVHSSWKATGDWKKQPPPLCGAREGVRLAIVVQDVIDVLEKMSKE